MLYTTKIDLEPKPYGPEQLKSIREKLNASQSLLAMFLGVSVKTLRSWEHWKQRIKIRG